MRSDQMNAGGENNDMEEGARSSLAEWLSVGSSATGETLSMARPWPSRKRAVKTRWAR